MRKLFIAVLASVAVSCSVEQLPDPGEPLSVSQWIGSTQVMPESDEQFYQDHPAPQMRRDFNLRSVPEEAQVYITAAGYYTLWVNGSRVGDGELSPAWTDYSKRIYYSQYDIKPFLQQGENVIAIELGNGWYNPLPLRLWGHVNLRERLVTGQPVVAADFRFYKKGKLVQQIITDQDWVWKPGPITRNNVYLGEWHDLRKNNGEWQKPGYDNSGWSQVNVLPAPGGKLEEAFFPPIRKTASQSPTSLWKSGTNSVIIDFGQNMAGWFRYSGSVSPGDTIRFRLGERIWPDSTLNTLTAATGQIKRKGTGGPGAPDVAEQMHVFVPATTSDAFEPRYSFHGFRYIEITFMDSSMTTKVKPEHFTAWRLNSDVQKIGSYDSGIAWINQIQDMADWTILSNLFSVASDCPAREKFGYGGDLNATAETLLYHFEVKTLFEKFVKDWYDAAQDDKFVDTAPFVGIAYCGIAWESAYLIIQDLMFRFYGDFEFVKTWYPMNLNWIDKAERLIGHDLARSGLGDHESLLPAPVELVGSLHYYQSLRIMQRFAAINQDQSSEQRFKQTADSYRIMLADSLWFHPVQEMKNPQTWISGLLYHGIIPDSDKQRALDLLVGDIRKRDVQLTTGIFGTPWMLEVLAKNGQIQLAYDLIARKDYPGWRYMMSQGATTFWETWKESDNVFSQNHPMFSSVSAFIHKWIGGIDPVDSGFNRLLMHPGLVEGLNEFSIKRTINNQEVGLSWTRTAAEIVFLVQVPNDTEVVWTPQIPVFHKLLNIVGPNGLTTTPNREQILLNDPGLFKITYALK